MGKTEVLQQQKTTPSPTGVWLMGEVRYNPETLKAIRLEDNKWVPTDVRHNAEGNAVAFDGEGWKPVGGIKSAPEQELSWSDRARLIASGALFEGGDEAAAALRSAFGSETWDEAIKDERQKLTAAEAKPGSTKYKIVGAGIPGLIAAPFTMGGSIAPTLARMAALGGADALATTIGRRKGNIVDRITENPQETVINTLTGTVAAPIIGKGFKYAGKTAKIATKPVRAMARALTGNKLPLKVERKIRAIAEQSGESFEDIVARVQRGETLSDVSSQAVSDFTKTIPPRIASQITGFVKERAAKIPAAARRNLQDDLAPESSLGNITKWFGRKIEDIEAAESASYNKIFKEGIGPSNSLNLGVQDALQSQKEVRKYVDKVIAAEKLPPIYEIVKGRVVLLDDVSLEIAEIVRRGLSDLKKGALSSLKSEKSLGVAIGKREDDLRKIIDFASPELAATRANWKHVKDLSEIYEDGTKLLNLPSEKAEILMDKILKSGDRDRIEALRSGVAFRLKTQAEKPSQRAKQIKDIIDEQSGTRIILERLYPDDTAEEAFRQINLAGSVMDTASKVKYTPVDSTRASMVGTLASGLGQTARSAVTGRLDYMVAPVLTLAGRVLSPMSNMSAKKLQKITDILISENPELVKRALVDPKYKQILIKMMKQTADRLQVGAASAGSYEVPQEMQRALGAR
jgi:hypothetical protein